MMEQILEEYVREKLAEVMPEVPAEQILVVFPSGEMSYSPSRRHSGFGRETLQAEIVITTDGRQDRLPVMRGFALGSVKVDGTVFFQKYTGHRCRQFAELSNGVQEVVYRVEFEWEAI